MGVDALFRAGPRKKRTHEIIIHGRDSDNTDGLGRDRATQAEVVSPAPIKERPRDFGDEFRLEDIDVRRSTAKSTRWKPVKYSDKNKPGQG